MLSPLDAAWVLIKQEGFTFADIGGSEDSGAFRTVYPHPTDSNKVVKIPHGELSDNSMIDVATNRALHQVGEPVLPERISTVPRDVKGYQDHTGKTQSFGTVDQPIFIQERAPYGPVQNAIRDIHLNNTLPDTPEKMQSIYDDRQVLYDAQKRFEHGGDTAEERRDNERLVNILAEDLHGKNVGINLPDAAVRRLVDEGDVERLADSMVSFDAQGALKDTDEPEGRYGAKSVARMMRANQIDPEKLNRFMELFGDRSQFDPLMDAMVHQNLGQPDPQIRLNQQPSVLQRREREGIEGAYNDYIKALNNAKRAKSYVDDPYQTRIGEYDRDFAEGDPTINHPSTALREAIIRARANQAKSTLSAIHEGIRENKRLTSDELTQDLMGGQQAMLRNDMGAELPMVRRLLGREQEKQKLAALHQHVMEGYLPMIAQKRYGGRL